MMSRRQDHDHYNQQSRVLYELSSMVLNILRSPAIQFSDQTTAASTSEGRRLPPITPAGFAALMLGISLSMMLCGSVTFFIGFLLFPWVIGLFVVFYFVGVVSSVSIIGRAFICYAIAPSSSNSSSPRKDMPAW